MRVTDEEYAEILKRPGVRGPESKERAGSQISGAQRPKKRSQPQQCEHQEQVALFRMAEQASVKYPELDLLNGSLNGVRLTIGQATKAKKAGMKRGYPDIFLPVQRKGYAGLYIEMKVKGGYLRSEQKAWLKRLKDEGYYCTVCYSALEAWDEIMAYLDV